MPARVRKVKLDDVAKAAGVSRGTASNVFSRPDIVSPELRERVLGTARSLGYAGPDPRGRMLRAGKVNAIGVAGPWPLSYFFDDPFARLVMEGIGEVCDEAGAGISLISALDERQVSWSIQSALVDGFVLFCMDGGSRLVDLTRERNLPFVALDFEASEQGISRIWVDDAAGARLAAQHLIDLGHRDFAVLALPGEDLATGRVTADWVSASKYPGPRDRIRGYFDILAAHGIDVDRVPIYETENDEQTTRAGMEALFSQHRPSAILAMSDRMAIVAIGWLAERGIDVPGQVSVIGFDGVPEGAHSRPPLTTVAQPTVEKGRLAAQLILDPRRETRQIELPLSLVPRGSTAAPKI